MIVAVQVQVPISAWPTIERNSYWLRLSRISEWAPCPEEFGWSQSEFTSFNLLVSHDFVITPAIEVVPSCLLVIYPNGSLAGLNATAKIHKWLMVGAGNRFRNGSSEFSFNFGINIKDWVQIITHCYSSTNQKYEFEKPYVETLLRMTVPERAGFEGK
jgi:hypothetical protein